MRMLLYTWILTPSLKKKHFSILQNFKTSASPKAKKKIQNYNILSRLIFTELFQYVHNVVFLQLNTVK